MHLQIIFQPCHFSSTTRRIHSQAARGLDHEKVHRQQAIHAAAATIATAFLLHQVLLLPRAPRDCLIQFSTLLASRLQ
jgi:hypothetical protein